MSDDLKIRMPEWARNMYNRLMAKIDAGGGGEENVIESISLNGVNVPPDANKNVALAESDPTVPSWAKATTKPSYTAQEVGALPANTPIPSKTSDLTNDSGFLTSQTGVTGVKGNAESSYRQGNVNLTPANIGAVAKSGDTMTGNFFLEKAGETYVKVTNSTTGVAVYLDSSSEYHGLWSNGYWNGSSYVSSGKWILYRNTAGKVIFNDTIDIDHGGTGATTKAGARTGIGIRYKDVTIAVGANEVITDIASSSYDVISLLHINPVNSVCKLKGAQTVNGLWYVFSEPVQTADARIRVLYIDK